MMSDWRGDARKTTPSRSWSYRAAAMCIISTAQHASPKVCSAVKNDQPSVSELGYGARQASNG